MYLAIAKSLFARGDAEAFRYAARCSIIDICPYLYSMLADGFGTEKNEALAMKVANSFDENNLALLKSVLSECRGER